MSHILKGKRIPCLCVLALLFCVQMLMHLNVDNLLFDDWIFFSVLDGGESILDFLVLRWQTWSSRLLIEGILTLLTQSIWAFRFLDSAVMVLMAWSLCRLADVDRRTDMLAWAACLVTTIPFAVLRSTGWMATSLNYYWPLAATLTAFIPLADVFWKRKTGRAMLIAAMACAVLGANQEQTAAVITGGYLVLGAVVMMREKRVIPGLAAVFAIGLIELVIHLAAPGNVIRADLSVAEVNLRDYGLFSIVDQLSIGLTSTTALLFFTRNPLFIACAAGVAGSIAARRRKVICLLPMGLVLTVYAIRQISLRMGAVDGWFAAMNAYGGYVLQLGPQRIQWSGHMEMMFLIVVMLGMMALSLYLSIGHRPLAAACLLVFAAGFAARMVLSFSPTVVESGERTMLPFYGAMMLCAMLCAKDLPAEKGRKWPMFMAFAVAAWLAGMNVLSSFALAA